MEFLIQQTLIYAIPLLIVALAGVFAERSGVVNLALEGTMIFGAFIGVLFLNITQSAGGSLYEKPQLLVLLTMVVSALLGAMFSLLLSFAAVNLKANQTISGTALNLLSPALVLFFINVINNSNVLSLASGDAASVFMLKKSTFGFNEPENLNGIMKLLFIDSKGQPNFFADAFLLKNYITTYVCILIFVVLSVILYKTRFGIRLRASGENPHAAASLGINVSRMRYYGTSISGALSGMGGFVFALTTANASATGEVAGFGFLALAVMIFGNWNPLTIAVSSAAFGLLKCVAAAYSTIDLNGDGVYYLRELGISNNFYRMLPYAITLVVLAFTSKKSRAPKAAGKPYDKSSR